MPSYKVVLKDEAKTEVRVTADDVEVDSVENSTEAWFNFYKSGDNGVTVAAIPFESVLYITS